MGPGKGREKKGKQRVRERRVGKGSEEGKGTVTLKERGERRGKGNGRWAGRIWKRAGR